MLLLFESLGVRTSRQHLLSVFQPSNDDDDDDFDDDGDDDDDDDDNDDDDNDDDDDDKNITTLSRLFKARL